MAYWVSRIVLSRELVAHETDSTEKSLREIFFDVVQSALHTHTKKNGIHACVFSARRCGVCVATFGTQIQEKSH